MSVLAVPSAIRGSVKLVVISADNFAALQDQCGKSCARKIGRGSQAIVTCADDPTEPAGAPERDRDAGEALLRCS